MVTFTATTGTDNPLLSTGVDIVEVATSTLIQAADTFQGSDGVDTILVGTKNATSTVDLSTAGSNGVAGFLNFEALTFNNSTSGNHTVTAVLSSAQFGAGKISDSLVVTGTTGANAGQNVVVNVVSGAAFSAAAWTFSLWNNTAGIDTVTLNGAAGNETITGSTQADLISGADGNDVLAGGNSNDVVNGGNGADMIAGQTGNDTLNGDAGNDTIYGAAGTDVIDGGADIDTVIYSAFTAPLTVNFATATTATVSDGVKTDSLSNIESFVLGAGNDTFNGGSGDDIVRGFKGNDVLNGGLGADTFLYGAGEGLDTINGGDGIDTVRIISGTINLTTAQLANWSNVEVIDASAATVAARVLGSTGADVINMSAYSQLINLELNGGAGNDTITGSTGGDVIVGGNGADLLTGNGGNDTFVFVGTGQSSRLVTDTITDFGVGDLIDLSQIDANRLVEGK